MTSQAEPLKLVRVRWQRRSLADVECATGDDDYGVYQVYGQHLVFGPGSLLYIGLAAKQSFAQRLKQHRPWLDHENDVSVRLGRLHPDDYGDDDPTEGWPKWSALVRSVESLLIFWHSPPYNSSSIVRYDGPPLHVQNWGDRGALVPELTSHWKPIRPDDPTT